MTDINAISNCHQCIPARLSLAFIVASGIIIIYISQVGISVAIVSMVTITKTDNSSMSTKPPFCLRTEIIVDQNEPQNINNSLYNFEDTTSKRSLEENSQSVMVLTTTERGFVLGAFFYGYVTTAILGGSLADKFGTKKVFAAAILFVGTANFFIPMAAKRHYLLLIALRFLIGVFQGVCYPSVPSLVVRWIPLEERSLFMSFTFVANGIGTIIAMSLSGVVITSFGWEYVFYITGGIFYVWLILWYFLMFDTPEQHPRISEEEKAYINKALANSSGSKSKSVPWRQMLTNIPLWAITISHCGNMFVFQLLLTQLPIFLSSIMGLSIRQNAVLSSLPFLARFLGSNFWSLIDSCLLKKKKFQIIHHRKFFNSLGMFSTSLMFVVVSFVGCREYVVMTLIVTTLFINGATISGYAVNWLDVAPNFGGISFGISNTVAFAITTSAPVIVGALTPDETLSQWKTVFWLISSVYLFCGFFFLCFASALNQSFNYEEPSLKNTNASTETKQ